MTLTDREIEWWTHFFKNILPRVLKSSNADIRASARKLLVLRDSDGKQYSCKAIARAVAEYHFISFDSAFWHVRQEKKAEKLQIHTPAA